MDIIRRIMDIFRQPEPITPEEEQQIIGIFGKPSPELREKIILDFDVASMTLFCELISKRIVNECEPLWERKYKQLYGKQTPMLYPRLGWKRNLLGMSVIGFGDNEFGQLGVVATDDISSVPLGINPDQFSVDEQQVKIIQVSAGGAHTVCLDENGNVWTFGRNHKGQLGLENTEDRNTPQRIDPSVFRVDGQSVKITQVSAGLLHTICLDRKGNVWTFGINDFGELGLGDTKNRNTPQRIPSSRFDNLGIIQISAGGLHTVCIDKNRNVWTFGYNKYGELGLGTDEKIVNTPRQINPRVFRVGQQSVKITQVSAGGAHTVCLDEKGNVWTFGWNRFGVLGLGTDERIVNAPRQINPRVFRVGQQSVKITQVSAGGFRTVCLDENGNVWSFGDNLNGRLGLDPGYGEEVNIPRRIDPRFFRISQRLMRITQVSVGRVHTVCIDENGNVWTFGINISGQLGLGHKESKNTPQLIPYRAVEVSAGGHYTMLIGL